MSKLIPIENNEQIVGYFFDCPGCKSRHAINIRPYNGISTSWTFNGDFDKPTFQPSILARVERANDKTMICHSFVTEGKIQFLGDCTHALAGQTVDIPEQ